MSDAAVAIFRSACGLGSPLTIRCHEAGARKQETRTVTNDLPFVMVGRDRSADIVLRDPLVSRRHAILLAAGGRLFCVDLLSRTSLRWNDEDSVKSSGWLEPGQLLRVGPYELSLPDRDGGPRDPEIDSAEIPSPFEDVADDSESLSSFSLDPPIQIKGRDSRWAMKSRIVLVGREPSCQMTLLDDSVSRMHAVLLRTPRGAWVIDLGAREGVLVNGTKVQWAWLADGDSLRIGRFTFVARYDSSAGLAGRDEVPLDAGIGHGASKSQLPVHVPRPTFPTGGELSLQRRATPSDESMLAIPSRDPSALAIPPSEVEWEPSPQFASQHFSIIRQQMQMMDSFHNDMILMMQMFAAMHREQRGSVRDEFEKVQHLTQELTSLQEQLANLKQEQAHSRASAARPDRPASSSDADDAEPAQTGPSRTGSHAREKTAENSSASIRRDARRPQGKPVGGRKLADEPEPVPLGDQMDVHSRLTSRIMELQRERQGYWQRILGAIGK